MGSSLQVRSDSQWCKSIAVKLTSISPSWRSLPSTDKICRQWWFGVEFRPMTTQLFFTWTRGSKLTKTYINETYPYLKPQYFRGHSITSVIRNGPTTGFYPCQQWCKCSFPNFITYAEWLLCSPELKGAVILKAFTNHHKTLRCLKHREWNSISSDELRRIAQNCKIRLCLYFSTKGGQLKNASICWR